MSNVSRVKFLKDEIKRLQMEEWRQDEKDNLKIVKAIRFQREKLEEELKEELEKENNK